MRKTFFIIFLLIFVCSSSWAGGPGANSALQNGSLTTAFMAEYLDLNTTTGTPDYKAGRLYYDMSEGVLAFMPIFDGPILQVGQENWMWGYNNTGSTITNGQAVCICSAIAGTVPTVTLAQANSVAGARTLALATMDVANNSYGFFTTAGKCNSLNTSMFSAGDCLYLSASTPGSLTNVIPASPNYIVEIGSVVTSSSTNGSIYVRIAPCGALCPAVFADDVEVKGSVTIADQFTVSNVSGRTKTTCSYGLIQTWCGTFAQGIDYSFSSLTGISPTTQQGRVTITDHTNGTTGVIMLRDTSTPVLIEDVQSSYAVASTTGKISLSQASPVGTHRFINSTSGSIKVSVTYEGSN